MEDSILDSFAADSDAFSPDPSPKKPKAKAAAKVSKAPVKRTANAAKATATKKTTSMIAKPKATVSKKRPKPDTEDEETANNSSDNKSVMSSTPPGAKKPKKATATKKVGTKPLQNDIGFDETAKPKPRKSIGASENYQKLSPLDHILLRPDTYIGSVEQTDVKMWVFNSQTESMESREVRYVPGLYKIFDEILVNAADNKQRDDSMDAVKVTIDREKGEISVWNNGRGIPVEIHKVENIYIPEMIFGHLLTSSNYNDEQEKVTGGRNGYGAKLCNIFSKEFILETADSRTGKKYKQIWTDNMSKMGKAKITSNKSDDYTKVTFTPDFSKFSMTGIDDDFEALVKRRVYDLAGTSRGVKVTLNGERVKIRNFKSYMEMYVKAILRESGGNPQDMTTTIITETPDARWEIGCAVSDGSFQQVSFVNSIATTNGGTHVNYIGDQIVTKLLEIIKKKNKNAPNLKNPQIRNHLFLFVNCLITNPAFTSQTKEQLTTKPSQFGSKCIVSEEFLKKLQKTDIVTNILHFAQQKADQLIKRTDGIKRSRMDDAKLTDANKAGTKEGWKCTLIITEGDSAQTLAIAGRAVVGQDYYGVFPLKGKVLNVRSGSAAQVAENMELKKLKQFIGLQHQAQYNDTKSLRYGHIMIMADQDLDGSHIKGLIMNYFVVTFPSLLRIPGFLLEFITPIVKVFRGDFGNPKQATCFYNLRDYDEWKKLHQNERGWIYKYYKGLGTFEVQEAQVYFRDLDHNLKEFDTLKDEELLNFSLCFSKSQADDRKEWLENCQPNDYLHHNAAKITYTDFLNKELIHFSIADNVRSIPNLLDGLKPTQRKILYTCFKYNIKKDMKVNELAGLVSTTTAYQHGDTSMCGTIITLAQTMVGTNNLTLLEPSGNFGTRIMQGQDAASPRYLSTRLTPFARKIFPVLDDPLLSHNLDETRQIEPSFYCPIVPLLLINGADGIGSGWSTSIPNYNPVDIVENIYRLMEGKEIVDMLPWYREWTGEIVQHESRPGSFRHKGVFKILGDNEIEINELPLRVATQAFKVHLESIIKAEKVPSFIKDYKDYNTHLNVRFVIKMDEKYAENIREEGWLEKNLKLSRSFATTNMVAWDPEGRLRKYETPGHILKEFYTYRLKMYQRRKEYLINERNKELEVMSNQTRFIKMIIDGKLVISKKKKSVLVDELKRNKFKPFPKVIEALKAGEIEPAFDDETKTDDKGDVDVAANAYDYLLGMALWSLTEERIAKLEKQMADKELEIDAFLKRSVIDTWRSELEEFLQHWQTYTRDMEIKLKLVQNPDQRNKLNSKAARKRKQDGDEDLDDEDFGAKIKKTKTIVKRPKPQPGLLGLKKLASNKPAARPKKLLEASSASEPVNSKAAEAPEETKKPAPRKPRAAAAKATKYGGESGSDSEFGNDLLGGVSNMVKGADTDTASIKPPASNGSSSLSKKAAPAGRAPEIPKPPPLSPAAKAYAAKKAKKRWNDFDSETEQSSPEVARPLVSQKKGSKASVLELDPDVDMPDSSPPPRAAAVSRPVRQSSTSQKKPKYIELDYDDDNDQGMTLSAEDTNLLEAGSSSNHSEDDGDDNDE
ncbi:MAG: DNA topoisomerase 2 [Trizodia sp. TS-e1964]|nr:MAG: DNA topoisomerase 2 [Trizodia sp. TS-e1964]